MNASKQKKYRTAGEKLKFRRKKKMALKLFESLEQFMMDIFLITLTQIEKTC